MKCESCGVPSKDNTRSCWSKYNMCIKCAIKIHPEGFSTNTIRRYGDKNTPIAKVSRYKPCPECNTIMSMLRYWKNGGSPSTNMYYCIPCQIVVNYDSRIRMIVPMEVEN